MLTLQEVKEWVSGWVRTRFFERSQHQQTSSGGASAGMPIVLDRSGRIDESFMTTILSNTYTFGGVLIDGPAGTSRNLAYRTSGSNRWIVLASSTAESGSNAGSDYQILARTDAGTALRTDLTITRSNGLWTLVGDINMAKTSPEFVFLNPTNQAIGSGTALGRLVFSVDDNSSGRVREEGAYLKYEGTGTWDGTSAPAKLSFGIRSSASGFTDDVMTIAQNGDVAFAGSLQSPTIVTPTIASFANATHNHQDAAGGGVLAAPGITSFANAQHNHTNAAGGGQLGTSALSDAAVTLAKLANLAQATIIGRASGAGTGVPVALTANQLLAIFNTASGTVSVNGNLLINSGGIFPGSGGIDFGLTAGGGPTIKGQNYTLNDDTAVAISPLNGRGVILLIPDQNRSVAGLLHFRSTGSRFMRIVAGEADLVATAGVLSGTTGTDGKVTISIHSDNNIYLENRSGTTLVISFTYFVGA